MPWSNQAGAPPQLLSSRVWEQQLLSPRIATEARAPKARALQQEKPPQREARTSHLESSPSSLQLEKTCAQQQRSSGQK